MSKIERASSRLPWAAVVRECREEPGIQATASPIGGELLLFLTVTDARVASKDCEMRESLRRVGGLVPVQYHQFNISDEDGPTGPDLAPEHNGLVQFTDGVATVLTGIHTGNVDVTATLHENEPTPHDGDWQECVEISAHSVSGYLTVRALMDDLDEELPVLSFDGPGDYRLRIHARGRDAAVDLAPDEVTEWYLVQVWRAPAGPATVLRRSDSYGASVRGGH
ncbi:hypothetical protein ACFU6S_36920 [Streptomyces sp. NPDC057456]|uniref:hypothetical protein n=1 Tax=Streptomyces sp. NPDC057456 TaxID=3346139 RepID=UPI0036A93F0E